MTSYPHVPQMTPLSPWVPPFPVPLIMACPKSQAQNSWGFTWIQGIRIHLSFCDNCTSAQGQAILDST